MQRIPPIVLAVASGDGVIASDGTAQPVTPSIAATDRRWRRISTEPIPEPP
ncbi:MAG TPA: hypothetical protein VEL07_08260 [Planctomycetota bacterium]|nr:hypothetical protein [Planctomycetota bacterium]